MSKTGRPSKERLAARRSIRGEWQDAGEGKCQRCSTVRRVYRPLEAPEIAVCAPCAAPTAHAGTSSTSRDEALVMLGVDVMCDVEAEYCNGSGKHLDGDGGGDEE